MKRACWPSTVRYLSAFLLLPFKTVPVDLSANTPNQLHVTSAKLHSAEKPPGAFQPVIGIFPVYEIYFSQRFFQVNVHGFEFAAGGKARRESFLFFGCGGEDLVYHYHNGLGQVYG
jgi:hypothetical protein